jgi:hypothetical protein
MSTDHLMIDGDNHEKVVMDCFNLLTWIPQTCESRKKSIRKAHEDRNILTLQTSTGEVPCRPALFRPPKLGDLRTCYICTTHPLTNSHKHHDNIID